MHATYPGADHLLTGFRGVGPRILGSVRSFMCRTDAVTLFLDVEWKEASDQMQLSCKVLDPSKSHVKIAAYAFL